MTSEDSNSPPTNVDNLYFQLRIKYFKSHLINMAEPCMHFNAQSKISFSW